MAPDLCPKGGRSRRSRVLALKLNDGNSLLVVCLLKYDWILPSWCCLSAPFAKENPLYDDVHLVPGKDNIWLDEKNLKWRFQVKKKTAFLSYSTCNFFFFFRSLENQLERVVCSSWSLREKTLIPCVTGMPVHWRRDNTNSVFTQIIKFLFFVWFSGRLGE